VSSQYSAAWSPLSRPIRIAYPATALQGGAGTHKEYVRQHWSKITIAVVAGILAGFLAGAVSSRENPPLTQVVYAAGVTTSGTARSSLAEPWQGAPATTQASAQEVSQLRAENEHLQALVDQLQKAHPATRSYRAKSHRRRRAHG
jgi:hypothetical protein